MIITGITVYELLGLIKDGQAPKKVKYRNEVLYYDEETKDYYNDEDMNPLFAGANTKLDKEVEIIVEENKIPEKLETYKENNEIFLENFCYKYMPIHKDSLSFNEQVIVDKLNEVLDYLKSKGDEKR